MAGNAETTSIVEGSTEIGALSAIDANGDPITWSFDEEAEGNGSAGGMFVIEDGRIKLAAGKVLDFEGPARSYTIHVKASDGHGGETVKSFTIDVTDMIDVIRGTNGANVLKGGAGADRLYGYGGNDVLNGGAGIDYMNGGIGNDIYYVDNTGDRVAETASGGTLDRVYTSVSHTLSAYVERLYATGSASVTMTGNSLNNIIVGNAGANKINGGHGKDVLKGGTKWDTFVFSTKLSSTNVDRILDYSVIDDTIQLDNAVFRKLGAGSSAAPRMLKDAYFQVGSTALDSNDYVIYNKAKGTLSYDADGSGKGAAVVFASMAKNLGLTCQDFFVI